ncbi:hypothetical protein [Haloechinothrix sp. LS1_15]
MPRSVLAGLVGRSAEWLKAVEERATVATATAADATPGRGAWYLRPR